MKIKSMNLKLWRRPTKNYPWEMVPGLAQKRENQKIPGDG